MRELHTFQCYSCKTVMISPFRAPVSATHQTHGGFYHCVVDYSRMQHLFSSPVSEDEYQAAILKGPQFNPGVEKRPYQRPGCDICGKWLYWYVADHTKRAVHLDGVGDVCSPACADEGARRHEAAMNKTPQMASER